MRAIDFLKEGGDVATGPSREDAIRWKPWDSEGKAWAVSPESWESEAAAKIENFLKDKWLALKQTLGIEVTPEEIENWKSRNYKAIQQVIIDDDGNPQWNPEWHGPDGETVQEYNIKQMAARAEKRKEYLDSLVPADNNDEQDYASQTPGKTTQIRPDRTVDRTVDRSKGRTSRLSNGGVE